MQTTPEQQPRCEAYLIALIEATLPLQQQGKDREVTLELLIEAAELLKQHLQSELQELREETAE